MNSRQLIISTLTGIALTLLGTANAADAPAPEKGNLVDEVRVECDEGKTKILQSTYTKGRILTITVASGNKYSIGSIVDLTVIRAFQAAGSATEEQIADTNTWLERLKPESPNYYARAKYLATDCKVIPTK